MPSPVVATAYALHMVATVIWIGGLVFLAFLAVPLLSRLPAAEREAARHPSAAPTPYPRHGVATVIGSGGLVSLAFLAVPLLPPPPAAEREAARHASARR